MQTESWKRAIPSLVTVLRILLLPIVVWFWLEGSRQAALGIYVILVLTDGIDGWTARHLGAVTRAGAMLDVLADILVTLALLGMLVWTGTVSSWLPIGPVLAAVLFLCTSGKGTPRYDPIGKYYGTALFLLVGVLLWTNHTFWIQATSYVIAGLSLIVLVNRAVYVAGRR